MDEKQKLLAEILNANTIKHNVECPDDLYKVADWLSEKING